MEVGRGFWPVLGWTFRVGRGTPDEVYVHHQGVARNPCWPPALLSPGGAVGLWILGPLRHPPLPPPVPLQGLEPSLLDPISNRL
jgi:hypothetical protein